MHQQGVNQLACAVNRRTIVLTLINQHAKYTRFRQWVLVAMSILPMIIHAQTVPSSGVSLLQATISTYGQAWASRDVDRILALHTADSVFILNVWKQPPAQGKEAIRQQFQQILRDNPQYSSKVHRMSWGTDFVVIEYSIRMQPVGPFVLGQRRFTPKSNAAYDIPAIDVIHVKEGLVSAKYTYIDTETVHANSSSVSDIGKP
jgi:ketosteroid isomerase-like protein